MIFSIVVDLNNQIKKQNIMKNLKKVSREQLKSIIGGFIQVTCPLPSGKYTMCLDYCPIPSQVCGSSRCLRITGPGGCGDDDPVLH